ncbi:MAG: hypothetical protein M0C28_30155 [Candidatus Moduliflexus flocculans]|nr:hypothetical protein [Candidatus Moduliflexus flocculans]
MMPSGEATSRSIERAARAPKLPGAGWRSRNIAARPIRKRSLVPAGGQGGGGREPFQGRPRYPPGRPGCAAR